MIATPRLISTITPKTPYHRKLAHWFCDRVNVAGDNISYTAWLSAILAIRKLCFDLSPVGFENIYAFYPKLGNNEACAGLNLVSTDYTATFTGSPTIGNDGVVFNGTDEYADTGIPLNNFGTSGGIGCFTKTQLPDLDFDCPMGGFDTAAPVCKFFLNTENSGAGVVEFAANTNNQIASTTSPIPADTWMFGCKVAGNDCRFFINENKEATGVAANANELSDQNYTMFEGCRNNNGTANNYIAMTMRCSVYTRVITDAQAILLNTAVQNYAVGMS